MLYIPGQIRWRTSHFTKLYPMKMYACATSSISNFWSGTWSLIFYLPKIMSPYISSVMGEWTWIKFAEIIMRIYARAVSGWIQAIPRDKCAYPFFVQQSTYSLNKQLLSTNYERGFFAGACELVGNLRGKAKQIHTIKSSKHSPEGKYRLLLEHTCREHLPRHLIWWVAQPDFHDTSYPSTDVSSLFSSALLSPHAHKDIPWSQTGQQYCPARPDSKRGHLMHFGVFETGYIQCLQECHLIFKNNLYSFELKLKFSTCTPGCVLWNQKYDRKLLEGSLVLFFFYTKQAIAKCLLNCWTNCHISWKNKHLWTRVLAFILKSKQPKIKMNCSVPA